MKWTGYEGFFEMKEKMKKEDIGLTDEMRKDMESVGMKKIKKLKNESTI